MTLCAMLLLSGCASKEVLVAVPEDNGPAFCDIEEPRRFTQAEIDWRSANAPWNLRRDLKTNEAWRAECESVP